jgi:hypothetical protein
MSDSNSPEEEPPAGGTGLRRAIGAGIVGAGAAAVGMVHPVLAIVAGALAPMIGAQLSEMMTGRAQILRLELDRAGVDFVDLNEKARKLSNSQLELIRESIAAALGTDYEIKVKMIVNALKLGLSTDIDGEVFAARRLARTVSRLDELEFRLLATMYASGANSSMDLLEIGTASKMSNRDIVRSSLAVLHSEGLVSLETGSVERWRLTDFGFRLGSNLSALFVAES